MDLFNRIIYTLTETHPLHPMLVHFPIALTGAGALFILLAAWRRNPALEQAAFANITLAFFGSIAAALTGMSDNMSNYGGTAPNARLKMLLATVLLTITGVTAFMRWRNPKLFESHAKAFYMAAYLASFALAIILAFLGGVILYGF